MANKIVSFFQGCCCKCSLFLLRGWFHCPGQTLCKWWEWLSAATAPPRGAGLPCSSPRCPSPWVAPGWGKEAPSTSCASCLHCHLLLRGSWRPSTNCIPWPSTSCQSVQLPLLMEQLPLLERLEVGKGQGEEAIFTFVSLQQLTMGATIQGRCYSAILIFSLFPRIVRFQQLGS